MINWIINWSFKPNLSLISLVMIVIWAEYLVPMMGLWSLIPFIVLMIIIDILESKIWDVSQIDEDEPEGICEYQEDLELVIPYLKEMSERGDGQARNLLYMIGESDDLKES